MRHGFLFLLGEEGKVLVGVHREEVLNANAPFEADEFFGKKRDDFQIRTTEYLALLLFGEFVVRLFVEKLVPPRSEEDRREYTAPGTGSGAVNSLRSSGSTSFSMTATRDFCVANAPKVSAVSPSRRR